MLLATTIYTLIPRKETKLQTMAHMPTKYYLMYRWKNPNIKDLQNAARLLRAGQQHPRLRHRVLVRQGFNRTIIEFLERGTLDDCFQKLGSFLWVMSLHEEFSFYWGQYSAPDF